jgi:outer membrane protein assembly factor BamA
MRSILTSAGLSTVTKTMYGPEGWSIFATAEFADKNFGANFGFNQYVLDVRRYQPLGRYDNLNVRLRAGTSESLLPVQKIFEIGGLSTLHGFPFKSQAGNRMILVNAEYIVNGDFLGELEFWPSWLMSGINFLVLGDAAVVRSEVPGTSWNEGFSGIRFSEFRHDVGVGVASRSGSFRLAYVWRTDQREPARFIFRFARPF